MKKKIFSGITAIAIAIMAVFNVTIGISNNNSVVLSLTNVEASAGFFHDFQEYWDRCDYDCVNVNCRSLFFSYPSQVAEFAGEGAGTVAHTWDCTGCGNDGWTS